MKLLSRPFIVPRPSPPRNRYVPAAALFIALGVTAGPCQNADSAGRAHRYPLDIPLLDAPYDFKNGFYVPSAWQSLTLCASYYQVTYPLIQNMAGRFTKMPMLRAMVEATAITSYVILSVYLPLGSSWLHEEYHRAVMKNRDIGSFNDIYKFNLFASTIAVSHVRDEDLVRLKREHPAELVRLHAAGYEGDNDLVGKLEKDAFFLGRDRAEAAALFNLINDCFYFATCISSEGDRMTETFNENEPSIEQRDFAGLDFTAWTYDLFRPDEPYAARGPHPSGTGIDRYILFADLSAEQQDYLRQQTFLSLLNLAKPSLYNIGPFNLKTSPEGTRLLLQAGMSHYLTPFGYVLNLNTMLTRGDVNLYAALSTSVNHQRYFPGIDLQLIRFPLIRGRRSMYISPRLHTWLQPRRQLFFTSHSVPGILAGCEFAFGLSPRVQPYLDLEGKTEGWVAGNMSLGPATDARLGLLIQL